MLQRFEAIELHGHSAQGQTLPLILTCLVDRGRQKVQAKFASLRNGLSARELAREIVCTVLAGQAGLLVSGPACVKLSAKALRDVERDYQMGILDSVGAGVRWIDFLRPLVLPVDISMTGRKSPADLVSSLRQTASRLLALDLLLSNGDRTNANPNLAWTGGSLLVFDFEHCLEFSGADFDRWTAIHLELLPNLKNSHIFGPYVSGDTLKDELALCLDSFNLPAITSEVVGTLPESWREPAQAILAYLEHVSRHRSVIIEAALADM